MNDQEVSAFASYTKKVSKKVNSGKSLGLGIKSKIKLKKKKVASTNKIKCFQKPPGNSQDSENLNSLNKKDISKSTNQKKIMKSLLMNQAESVFDECNSKVKLNGNTFEENKSRNDKADKIDSGAKKTKKIKVLNGEVSQNFTASEAVEVKETESTKSKKRKLDELESEEFNSPSLIYGDSVKMGEELLAWMLSPVEVKNFFNDCWEKKPLHIKRKNKDFFKCICTFKDFRTALRENDVYFTKNIDVTSYIDGKKYTENLEGKATVPVVWDFFNQGKSIRMLNPQTFIPNVRLLNSTLQVGTFLI